VYHLQGEQNAGFENQLPLESCYKVSKSVAASLLAFFKLPFCFPEEVVDVTLLFY